MDITKAHFKVTGVSPLLMHSDRASNPMSEIAKQIREISSKRKKTEEDHAEMIRLDWLAGLYLDDSSRVAVPVNNIRACFRDGAKITREGKEISRKLQIDADAVPLEYVGPKGVEALWKDGKFLDVRGVGIQGKRVQRARPIFRAWALSFEAWWVTEDLDVDTVSRIATTAGRLVGMGDYRPDKGGTFGRFTVEVTA